MVNRDNYFNHTGGAKGADSTWDEIGREYGFLNHYHYWFKKMNPKSEPQHQISEEDYLEGVKMIEKANLTLKRRNLERYMYLLARNWIQVKNSECIFAIGFLQKNMKSVKGGTGWATQMAVDCGKDVFIFDQEKEQWYFWNKDKYEYCTTPSLTNNYAGIGSRDLYISGEKAIRDVYLKTIY